MSISSTLSRDHSNISFLQTSQFPIFTHSLFLSSLHQLVCFSIPLQLLFLTLHLSTSVHFLSFFQSFPFSLSLYSIYLETLLLTLLSFLIFTVPLSVEPPSTCFFLSLSNSSFSHSISLLHSIFSPSFSIFPLHSLFTVFIHSRSYSLIFPFFQLLHFMHWYFLQEMHILV